MKNIIVVINASRVLEELISKNEFARGKWMSDCRSIRASYKQKTSRMEKNGKTYEYTKWYREKDTGGLECIGKDEPEWKKILPKEPEMRTITAKTYRGQLIMEQKDYEANIGLFLEYLVFRLEDCKNLLHPLFKNPEKALKGDSVRRGGVSSAGSQISGGTENKCWNEGDCESCSHSDDCPVNTEQDELDPEE
ncbi:MAG: hypothetical protein FIB07_16260 [Candidatus Methanoperedens sp.]|nr:hypothetical protein [Candidatus Methanoperedens sp.]